MPDVKFLDKNGLDHNSQPYNFFDAFLPGSLLDTWSIYTNTKAMRANAGRGGKFYLDFKDCTCSEFKKRLGFYILHGILPSPRTEMKFNNQKADCVNGNDFVHRMMIPNTVL